MRFFDNSKFSARHLVAFLVLQFVLQATSFGPGVELVLFTFMLSPFCIAVFWHWDLNSWRGFFLGTAIRTILLFCILFVLQVARTRFFGGGQVGFGEFLQVKGKLITPLGYAMFAGFTLKIVLYAAAAAILSRILVRKRS